MEKAEKLVKSEETKIDDNAKKLDKLNTIKNIDKDICLPGTEDIRETIKKLESFNDFPISIDYKDKEGTSLLPKTLDMWPKPFGNKREDIDGKIIEKPDYLLICLNNRKFKVNPDVGRIDNIIIEDGNIILKLKIGFVGKDEEYKPDKMTKLLLLLRSHTSGYNKDIPGTVLATVKEIK